jgi:outer membrane lipoprotein-sorting protein
MAQDSGKAHPENKGEEQRLLLKRFASIPGLFTKYREEKFISLLVKPLVSEGEIFFYPPNNLARYVQSPEKSVVIIRGDKLKMTDSSGSHELDLSEQPVLRLVIDTFIRVLSGDIDALSRVYRIRFSGQATGAWQVYLEPIVPTLSRYLRQVFLEGNELIVSRMEITETNGDRTVTRFFDVDVSRRYSNSERERLFGNNLKR